MTTTKTKRLSKEKSKGINISSYIVIIGILLLCLSVYIAYRIQISQKNLIPLAVIALIIGMMLETKRLTEKWSTVLLTALGAFVFSFIAFLPGKREVGYNFESHIEIWPYSFIFFFIIFVIVLHKDKIIPKLTEGITLLQSVAIIYWVIDYGFFEVENIFMKVLLVLGLLFSLFSLFHAFSKYTLSRTSRLVLSIWSSMIMLLFSIDNIYQVYQSGPIENSNELIDAFFITLQYFLLGVSSIYMTQNFYMLAGFLPGKTTFFNKQYFIDVKELKTDHIQRYADTQVSISHSFLCIVFTGAVFAANYYYDILPVHMAIWTVFVIFPYLLLLYETLKNK